MPASLIHFVLIHAGTPARPNTPRILHFGVQNQAGRETLAHTTVDLLVIDARRMTALCAQTALNEVARMRGLTGVRHGVLVCEVPRLPLVIGALRAGLRDIIQEPLTARQLVQMLRAASPGRRACAEQLAALAALVRTLAADRSPAPASTLARREFALEQRAEKLTHMETRLALERAALEDREQKLRAHARRVERQFATLQNDADIPKPEPTPTASPFEAPPHGRGTTASPFSASPFVTDLQSIADQLAERTRALDIRERMLREMEGLLLAQTTPSPSFSLS